MTTASLAETQLTEMTGKIPVASLSGFPAMESKQGDRKSSHPIFSDPRTDQCSRNRGKPENGNSEGASQRVALLGLSVCSKGRCQIWHLTKRVTLHRCYPFQRALNASTCKHQTRTPAMRLSKENPMRFSPVTISSVWTRER